MSRNIPIVCALAAVLLLVLVAGSVSKGSQPGRWNEPVPRIAAMPIDTPPPHPQLGPGDPTTRDVPAPFSMPNPSNLTTEFELDKQGTGYFIYERIGGIDVRPPSHITIQEFLEWRKNNTIRDHWQYRAWRAGQVVSGTDL